MTTTVAPPYTMRVDLSVLESLGMNLYSNAAAVLSELVANSYDAEAFNIDVTWTEGGETVTVTDDGSGMTRQEINDRFLRAGYKKRVVEGHASPKFGRPFMGRKGIGKLAVFSIARVIDVYSTTEDGTGNGLRLDVTKLEEAIAKDMPYHPDSLDVPDERKVPGTTLVLTDLKKKRTALTAAALRKRLARRFDVLDERSKRAGGFNISVNGRRLTWADRRELQRLQFIWEFGEKTLPESTLTTKPERFVISNDVVDAAKGWKVTGWFGTTKKPTDLVDDAEAGSLKNIIVLARGRPIQEGIIEDLDFSKIFGSYVTGQIQADFLDLDEDGYDDIATSDRQRLIEDDERVVALRSLLRKEFNTAAEQWAAARPSKETPDAMARYPKLKDWIEKQDDYQRPVAERLIGTIAALVLEDKDENSRKALFRAGVLAFERIGLRHIAKDLDDLPELRAEDLLRLLGHAGDYEAGLWGDILRARVESIEGLQRLVDAHELEKVIQQHVFDNLHLLDPAWERATGSERMEENLNRFHPGVYPTDSKGDPITGRVDIRYVTNVGAHKIVELKKYERKTDVEELVVQGRKYYAALRDVLQKTAEPRPDDIEVIFVLGSDPTGKDDVTGDPKAYIASQLNSIKGRVVLYDAMIDSARIQYEAYWHASKKVRELDDLLDDLGEGDPDGRRPLAVTSDVPVPVDDATRRRVGSQRRR